MTRELTDETIPNEFWPHIARTERAREELRLNQIKYGVMFAVIIAGLDAFSTFLALKFFSYKLEEANPFTLFFLRFFGLELGLLTGFFLVSGAAFLGYVSYKELLQTNSELKILPFIVTWWLGFRRIPVVIENISLLFGFSLGFDSTLLDEIIFTIVGVFFPILIYLKNGE